MLAKAPLITRMLLGLACCGWPLISWAGGSDAEVASAWLLNAFLLIVAVVQLLVAGAFATRLLVWPRLASLLGIIAVLLLAGFLLFVLWVVLLLLPHK